MGDTNAQIGPENGLEHVIGKEGMGMTYENGEILIYLSAQAIIGYRWNNLHHWHYSPGWALASSNKCRQRLLSWATIFQFLHPIFLKSCSTPSIHLSFGLPRPCCPPGFEINILGFFQTVKILSMTSFGKGSKAVGSRVVDLRHVKEPQAEIRASEQNLSVFSRSMSEATLMT